MWIARVDMCPKRFITMQRRLVGGLRFLFEWRRCFARSGSDECLRLRDCGLLRSGNRSRLNLWLISDAGAGADRDGEGDEQNATIFCHGLSHSDLAITASSSLRR